MDRGLSRGARAYAGGIAALAWAGVGIQLGVSAAANGSVLAAAWHLLLFFTIITNLGLAVGLTGATLGRPGFSEPALLGGITLAILLVGIVYSLLLAGTVPLTTVGAIVANTLMHYLVPIHMALFWLIYAPKGKLRAIDPLIWSIYPLTYFAYALMRGGIGGHYPYPFMDVGKIGWAATAINATAIAAGFLLTGYLMLFLDRTLAPARK